MNKDPYCSCSCHIVKETNVICYSCLCDIEKERSTRRTGTNVRTITKSKYSTTE